MKYGNPARHPRGDGDDVICELEEAAALAMRRVAAAQASFCKLRTKANIGNINARRWLPPRAHNGIGGNGKAGVT